MNDFGSDGAIERQHRCNNGGVVRESPAFRRGEYQAVHVALQLEAQVRTALDSEKRLKETQNGSGNKTHMDITISKDS
jgi:hypothetical protein